MKGYFCLYVLMPYVTSGAEPLQLKTIKIEDVISDRFNLILDLP